jgi:hypothetical protein
MWPFSFLNRKRKTENMPEKKSTTGGNGKATDVGVAREEQDTPIEVCLADCEMVIPIDLDNEVEVEENTGDFPATYNKPGIEVKEKARAQQLHKHDSQSRRVLCDMDRQIKRLKKIREKIKEGSLNGKKATT